MVRFSVPAKALPPLAESEISREQASVLDIYSVKPPLVIAGKISVRYFRHQVEEAGGSEIFPNIHRFQGYFQHFGP